MQSISYILAKKILNMLVLTCILINTISKCDVFLRRAIVPVVLLIKLNMFFNFCDINVTEWITHLIYTLFKIRSLPSAAELCSCVWLCSIALVSSVHLVEDMSYDTSNRRLTISGKCFARSENLKM